jgi:hypothetical protein
MAMHAPVQPDEYLTVFAGQDLEATAQMRSYLQGIPPSSPFLALFKNGQPVFVLERRNIEGRSASAIAHDLAAAYQTHCSNGQSKPASDSRPQVSGSEDRSESATPEDDQGDQSVPETFRSIL